MTEDVWKGCVESQKKTEDVWKGCRESGEDRRCLVESQKKTKDVWKGCVESEEDRRCLEGVCRVRRRPKLSGRGV